MHIRELPWIEPVTAIQSLAGRPYLTFLDSAAQIASLGRYSYVACDPFTTFVITEGQAYRNGEGADIYIIRVDPFMDELRGHPRFEALAEKIVPAREFKGATASK